MTSKLQILKGQAMGYMFMYTVTRLHHYLVAAYDAGLLYKKYKDLELDKTDTVHYNIKKAA